LNGGEDQGGEVRCSFEEARHPRRNPDLKLSPIRTYRPGPETWITGKEARPHTNGGRYDSAGKRGKIKGRAL